MDRVHGQVDMRVLLIALGDETVERVAARDPPEIHEADPGRESRIRDEMLEQVIV